MQFTYNYALLFLGIIVIIELLVFNFVKDKNTPVFVYCLSGGRSAQAANKLKQMGFTEVNNIGGINSYKGVIER